MYLGGKSLMSCQNVFLSNLVVAEFSARVDASLVSGEDTETFGWEIF